MPGLQEYVIRLSTDVDNMGVQKLMSIMDTNKMKALGLTAALTAATTAVYKWVESATKQEMELDKLAKKQKKSIEQTRAEQEALKQMGMTLDEIKKDKALKEIYDDLVKFNKEMQMPNAANMLGKVRELQSAFWKLKSAVNYLVQSIGAQLLINLEKPIERITNTLGKGANWLKNNLTSIGTKITGYLTAFAKGVIGIAEGVGKIFNWLGQMPEGIKSIAGTIATVFALIKSGPIGQIMALITAAGNLIHDYENSQWNKENRENTQLWNDGKGGYTDKPTEFGAYQVPLAYEGLWSYLDSDTGSLREKAKTITTSILEGIKDALDSFSDTLNSGEGLTEWLETLTGPIGDILGGVQDALGGEEGQKQIAGVLTKFFTTAASLCKAGGKFGSQIFGSVAGMVANIFGAKDIWEDSNVKAAFSGNNGFANGLMATIETALIGGNWWESILTGVMGGYQTEREKALKKLYQEDNPNTSIDWDKVVWGKNGIPSYTELEEMYGKDSRLAQMLGTGVQESFNTFISGVLEMLVGGINIASDICGNILNTIIQAVVQGLLASGDQGIADNVSQALNSEGAKDVMDSIGAGIGSWILSGNFFVGILGSVVSFVSQSIQTSKEQNKPLWDTMKEKVADFWDSIQDIIYGPLIEGKFNSDGTQKRDRQYGLISVIEPLLWGEMETVRDTVQNVLESAEDKVTGKKYWARKGGILNWLLGYDTTEVGTGDKFRVKGIFEKLWEGADGESGIKGFFIGLGDKIVEWLTPAFNKLGDALAVALYNAVESAGIIDFLAWLGIGVTNPNTSTIAKNDKGEWVLTSTNGKSKVLTNEELGQIGRSNINTNGEGRIFGVDETTTYNLSIDKDGQVVVTNRDKSNDEFKQDKHLVTEGGFPGFYGLDGKTPWIQSAWYADEEYAEKLAKEEAKRKEEAAKKEEELNNQGYKTTTLEGGGTYDEGGGLRPDSQITRTDGEPGEFDPFWTPENGSGKTLKPIGYIASAGMSDVGGMGRSKGAEEGSEAGEGVAQLGKQSDSAAGAVGDMATDASNAGSTLERFDTEVDLAASKAETLGDKVKGASLDLQESSEHFKTVGSSLESITGSAAGAKGAMDSLASGASHAAGVLSSLSAGGSTPGAMGGRFDRATEKRVGEAGTEYLIPITKPERAFSLILQALSEMGSDMIKRVTAHFGGSLSEGVYDMASGMAARVGKDFALGTSGTVGGSLGGIESALQNMQQNFNYNISAPVTIQVQSSGASAQEIGTAAYDAAERRLLKTLRGAYA